MIGVYDHPPPSSESLYLHGVQLEPAGSPFFWAVDETLLWTTRAYDGSINLAKRIYGAL